MFLVIAAFVFSRVLLSGGELQELSGVSGSAAGGAFADGFRGGADGCGDVGMAAVEGDSGLDAGDGCVGSVRGGGLGVPGAGALCGGIGPGDGDERCRGG